MINFTKDPEGGVGLAAPQVGRSLQIIVIEDRADYQAARYTPEQLAERERTPVPLHVIINPKITIEEEGGIAEFFEGCLSLPHLLAVVPRSKVVHVECLNEKGEAVSIQARGWYARVLQHEIDHLNGILFLDRAYLETLTTRDNLVQ